ncbi:hypothetical protein C5E07_13870 [Pseudoclavibacter sp. RFBJ3]|nr:hypothetical protein C5C12_13610 [Pseudoclavibacter sp. RFBJ5]PPF90698.1 hypothetical protein C5E07_13870 [Pseudoclavibacter sp. RFBJ3]PPF95093.1 hypothetical protein C5C19_17655 [Pseudoclavibacter sp. RFBH5]PPG20995.1 hypothetical protein C5E13_13815 [Pseudoclavibacter sp. RFBI4]
MRVRVRTRIPIRLRTHLGTAKRSLSTLRRAEDGRKVTFSGRWDREASPARVTAGPPPHPPPPAAFSRRARGSYPGMRNRAFAQFPPANF